MSECDLLLKGGAVVTVDDERRVVDPGDVAIAGDRIVAVGAAGSLGLEADRTIDCRGKAVLPGLVDCHNHLFQGLARGLGEGMSLWPWLCEFMWPYSTAIDADDAAVAAMLGAIEAARAGTTTIVDNHYSPADLDTTLRVADAIETVGLRGFVARGMFGDITTVARDNGLAESLFRYSLQEELDITRDALEDRAGRRVGVWPAPINIIYVEQELVRRAAELARSYGINWHAHCSEAQIDPDLYLRYYRIRPFEWLAQEGLLDRRATLAHSIWLNDAEVEAAGLAECGIAYNPTSNQYLASGSFRLRALRDAGAVIGLGTDGPGCGHRQDLFEQIKQAILVQRLATLDPEVSNVEEALELATRDGARYAELDAGQLAEGKLADVAVVELEKPHLRPLHRIVGTLGYSVRGSDVAITIVGGSIIYEHGRMTTVDEDAVMAEAEARAAALIRRAGLGDLCAPWIRR